MGTTPPSSNSRHHRYRWIGWRSRSFYPPPKKNKRHWNHPPLQQCAPSPVLKQVDGRPRPVFEGIGGRPPIPGIEPAPSRRAPGALPPGRLPSEIHRHPGHRTNAPATPSPCTKSRPAVGLLCWAMNRDIGAPLQPRSPQPPHASRRAKLRAHQARHENPAGRRLDTKTTPLSPPARTERGPHNRTPATQTPTAHLVDGQMREEERPTPHATVEGTPPGTPSRRPRNPKPSRGEPGPDRPPPSTPDGARDRGRTRGGARTTWNGPTSAQCRDHARCARHTTQRGADTARARAHTHEKDTRGPPEGQPDRARGTHRPHGMAYQRARIRDTRTGRPATRNAGYAGREGGRRGDTTPGTGPNPPEPAASAAHTQTGHCTRQGSSGAQRHAPTPRLGSHRASPRGSHWRQASSTGPAAPVPRATTH